MKLTTIRKKQIIAATGLLAVSFLIMHLSGNFLIFKGHEVFNNYALLLKKLGAFLWLFRGLLLVSIVAHIYLTISLAIENRRARGGSYAEYKVHTKSKKLSSRTMAITGLLILAYLIWHLFDFTFAEHVGIVGGQDLGLYGLVVNEFKDPIHAFLYIAFMCVIGFHLSHAIQSVLQTFGLSDDKLLARYQKISLGLGIFVAAGFSSIPLYVLFCL